jgi:solute:Na+ symporter, SSS family
MLLNGIVIGMYFIFLAAIGLVFKRLNRDEDDYFRAGSRSCWWMVGMSLLMSGISTQTFIANAGVAFHSGFSVWWIYIVNALCALVLALGVAAWYRQARVTTFAEIVRDRFGPSFQQFFTYYNIVWLVIGGSIGLYMLALFAHTAFGIPVKLTIVALGIVVLFYTLTGGNWAVLAADFLQSLVLFSMAVLMAVLCLNHIGGIDGFLAAIQEQGLAREFRMLTPGRADGLYGLEWLVGVGIIQVYAALGMQGGQRFFSCKDGREAKKAAWLYFVVGLIGMTLYFIPPMVARLMYSGELGQMEVASAGDISYAFMALKLLPFGFVPLMVVAMFSAQMSTMDTALNANSALFVKNAYPALMRLAKRAPRTDHKFLLALGRGFTILLGVGLVCCALYFASSAGEKGIFELTFRINAILGIPLLMPLFLGYFIRKTPLWSGWACLVAGLIASVLCTVAELPSFRLAIVNSGVGFLAFIATGLFWSKTSVSSKQQLNQYFTRLHTPVNFDEETGEANDARQFKLIGILAISLGGFIALFLLLPNDGGARLCIAAVALPVFLIGAVMLGLSRRAS